MARQNFVGMVISHGKMDKTIKVRVQRIKFNKLVNKNVVRFTDFLVHDQANKCKEGDVVRIQYVRPLSARKSFAVTEILVNKGLSWIKYREEAPARVAQEELAKITQYKADRAKILGEDGSETISQQLDNLRIAQKIQFTTPDESTRSEEEKALLKKVLEKYGGSINLEEPLFQLGIQEIRNKFEELNLKIEKSSFSKPAAELLQNNPEEANKILRSQGKLQPESIPKNIKKNLLMKYFVKTLGNKESV